MSLFFAVITTNHLTKMSMTSPEDIEKWFEGTQLYDRGEMADALKKFAEVTQNSRILFNMGCCCLTINDIESAAEVSEWFLY